MSSLAVGRPESPAARLLPEQQTLHEELQASLAVPIRSAREAAQPLRRAAVLRPLGGVLQGSALVVGFMAFAMVIVTALSVVLLGPFGFLPALLIAPLYVLGELLARCARLLQERIP